MIFVGTHEHTIDDKGRLAIPSDIRQRLDPQTDGPAFYAVVQEGPTLALYTERGFERRAEQLDEADRPAEEVLLYERLFYSLAQRLEPDQQGRVLIPERLVRMAGLGRDVVLIGVKDHMEVHDRDKWFRQLERLLEKSSDLLVNPRRLIRGQSPKGHGPAKTP